jgi:two-component system, NtrC family, nitrogen regulation sensor histidine kinase NtrY
VSQTLTMRFSTRILLAMSVTAIGAIATTMLAVKAERLWEIGDVAAALLAALLVSPVVVWSAHLITRRIDELNDDLGNALRATRDGDHSLRLVVRGDREIADLKRLYNELADAVRRDRQVIHGKGVLLDTILQRTPVGVLLLDVAGRVIFSNSAARELLSGGSRLDGRLLEEIGAGVEAALRDALAAQNDTLFHVGDETFHLAQRLLRIHNQPHRLILLERLTPELRRQEVTIWKKAIRVINHEINNSIAPISSLFHSAKKVQETPEHRHRLDEIHELIHERLGALAGFLDSYAQFARLPEPRRERVAWAEIFDVVRALYGFRVEGNHDLEAAIDRAQIQQVVINLVKNAHESGSDPDEVVVSIRQAGADAVLSVLDRGRGMSDEVIRQALVPFYTTKPGGSGLGLALSNEIVEAHGGQMRIAAREGRGTEVTCWLPVGGAGRPKPSES